MPNRGIPYVEYFKSNNCIINKWRMLNNVL